MTRGSLVNQTPCGDKAPAYAGVLEVRHGDGTYVRAKDETEAARRAAERRRPEDLRRIGELTREAADGERREDVVARAMVPIEFYRAFSTAVADGMRRLAIDRSLPPFDVDAHHELHVAIVVGDPERAGREAARHIDHILEGVREQLGRTR
ncbi:hypothetical protein ABJI51_40495 [Amycolatopsis sp. NEAU-NG30]|uniref:FCD domain-containing protein n=1 Tax=Amycolatopsis melonis TaxID=3156488 RepID=A0ABV0LSV8_9PSEU